MSTTKDSVLITRIAAIVTLIQALVWLPVAIVGIQLYQCKITVTSNGGISYLIYLLYFFNVKCGAAPEFLRILETNWPLESVSPSERTWVLCIVMLTFHVFWILTSVALLVSTLQISFIQRIPKFVFFFSWILVTIAVLVMDVVVFSLYAYDFYKTSSPEGLLQLLGVTNLINKPNWKDFMPTRYYNNPAVPTAVLLPLASRLFPVLAAIDLFLLIKVVRLARQHEVKYRETLATISLLSSNPLYRLSRWKYEGAQLQLRPSDVPREEQEQAQHLNANETTQLNQQNHEYAVLEQQEGEGEEPKHQQQPKSSEYEEVNVTRSNDENVDDDGLIYEPPINSNPGRSSILSRLSTQNTPQGLHNQLPWSYLGRPTSESENPLSSRASNVKNNGDG